MDFRGKPASVTKACLAPQAPSSISKENQAFASRIKNKEESTAELAMPGPPASDIAQRQSSRIGEARAWLEVITRPQWTPNRVSSGGKTFEGSSEWPPAPKASWPESLALAAALCCWPLAIPAPCPWAASGSSSGANPQPACPNPTLTFPSPSLGCKGPSPSPSETHRDLRGTCPLRNPTPLPHQPPGAG